MNLQDSTPNALERITNYLLGEMNVQEKQLFEQELSENPDLRQDFETMKEAIIHTQNWLEADTPGSERVAHLQTPTLKTHVSSYRGLKRLAVAAVFVLGFGLGLLVQKESELLGSKLVPPISDGVNVSEETKPNPTVAEATPTPNPNDIPQSEQARPNFAKLSERIRTREQNQRLIIETDQSYWIVDGRFQLNENEE